MDFEEIARQWERPVQKAERPVTFGEKLQGIFQNIRIGCAIIFWGWVILTALAIVIRNMA